MSDENEPNQGLPEAHPRAEKIGSTAAMVEAAMTDLAQRMAGGQEDAEQQSLMLDDIDEHQSLFAGPVAHVASTIADARRARGRPKGSQNKASKAFADTLMRMGYRHPGLNLAALANADPLRLAVEMAGFQQIEGVNGHEHLMALAQSGLIKRSEIMALINSAHGLILKANAELLPYFESKQATKIDVDKTVMGVMVIGEMPTAMKADTGVMDLTRFEAPEKDQ